VDNNAMIMKKINEEKLRIISCEWKKNQYRFSVFHSTMVSPILHARNGNAMEDNDDDDDDDDDDDGDKEKNKVVFSCPHPHQLSTMPSNIIYEWHDGNWSNGNFYTIFVCFA
jgi:hypothetical protein